MEQISIGAIGAAIIAGLVSLLGLIIGKEQKVSEFRQLWIDELRKCFVSYITNVNIICDVIRLKSSGKNYEEAKLLEGYKLLNEASLGIKFRINHQEENSKSILDVMKEFEELADSNETITLKNVRLVECKFNECATRLLKDEWSRVKDGEPIFVKTKRTVLYAVIMLAILFVFMLFLSGIHKDKSSLDCKTIEYSSSIFGKINVSTCGNGGI